jgi:hypothetical protein
MSVTWNIWGAMRGGRCSRGLGRTVPLLCAVVLALPAAAVADDLDGGISVTCQEQRVAVALAPDRPADQTYAEDICFEQYVIPGAGHDVNVHFESYRWFAVAAEWTKRMVQDGGPCRG